MDRGRTGYISLQALVDRIYPNNREGGKADRGRDRDQDRDRGDRDGSRGSRGDDDMNDKDRERGTDRVSALVLKANESRVLFKKRPDLLQELLLQMRTVRKERGYVHTSF